LKILVQDLNKYVAISEEFANSPEERSKSGGNLFDRKVTRVITPGTLIDEKFMDPWENNFLLSITAGPDSLEQLRTPRAETSTSPPRVGLSWVDVSSGDFFTQESDVLGLASVIARVGPREIVIDSRLRDIQHSALLAILKQDHHVVTYHGIPGSGDSLSDWQSTVAEDDTILDPQRFKPLELAAGNLLLHYVKSNLQGNKPALQAPVHRDADECMLIDRSTLKALEIRSTLRDGSFQGSLLHAVRKTVTKSGSRLLSQRLSMRETPLHC